MNQAIQYSNTPYKGIEGITRNATFSHYLAGEQLTAADIFFYIALI